MKTSNQRSYFTLILSECFLILLFCASCLFMIALYSHSSADAGWSRTGNSEEIYHNWLGQYGAYYSDLALYFLGFISYFLPVLFICLVVRGALALLRTKTAPKNYFLLSFLLIGFWGFIIFGCGFFSLAVANLDDMQSGGILGDLVVEAILPQFGYWFSSVFFFICSFVCLTLLLNIRWLTIFEKIGCYLMQCTKFGLSLIAPYVAQRFIKQNIEMPQKAERASMMSTAIQSEAQEKKTSQPIAPKIKIAPKTESAPLPRAQEEAIASPLTESKPKTRFTRQQLLALEKTLLELQASKKRVEAAQANKSASESLFDRVEIEPDFENVLDEMQEEPSECIRFEAEIESEPHCFIENHDNNDNRNDNERVDLFEEKIIVDESIESRVPLESIFINTEMNPKIAAPQIQEETESTFEEVRAAPELEAESEWLEPEEVPFSAAPFEPKIEPKIEASSPIRSHIAPQTQSEKTVQHMDDRTYLMSTKDDSVIHPFLRKNNLPMEKPLTPLPQLSLLNAPPEKQIVVDYDLLEAQSVLLERSLSDFRVKCRVVGYEVGPVITRFEVELAPGVKASRVTGLDRDIARSMSLQSVRVVEVIPGKPYVGVEVPNPKRQMVYFKEVLESVAFQSAKSPLTLALGQDISGEAIVADLAKMPHLLVAGTTGSGKSVGVNAMILSILYKAQPDQVRFIMIDPKMLELSIYKGIPHLLTDVITDMKDVANALNWCVEEMESRYRLMAALGVRNIIGYNERVQMANDMNHPIPDPNWTPTSDMNQSIPYLEKLPYIVVVVDEFADLMMTVGKTAEELIMRLAQKARAAGIHIILATQRPSVDVITGLIKANIPTRIGFTVSSKIDSRTILDQMGAENLLGMGDMLYLGPNNPLPIRVHGAFIDEHEIDRVVQDWKARNIVTQYIDKITQGDEPENLGENGQALDPLFDQICDGLYDLQAVNISQIQRAFGVGYNRSAKIVDQLVAQGIVSKTLKNNTREILIPRRSDAF